MSNTIRLIIGLANPGEEYAFTRHNAGAWYVNLLSDQALVTLKTETKLKCSLAKFNSNTLLAIPTTYMNESGQALQAVMHYYKIKPNEILVAHDEIDLPTGEIRIKADGGHGGHNGLRDIFKHIGTQNFLRLRIGVGRPAHKNQVTNYVLKPPSKDDRQLIDDTITQASHYTDDILQGKIQYVMKQLHTKE